MRNYGRAFMKNQMQAQTQNRVETRDAVVFDIDTISRLVRVKIQGSTEYIIAHFPQNWQTNPAWLKIGNAVRIQHRGGIRGRIEVVSDGQVVPTGTASAPSPVTPDDAILTGCNVVQIPTGPQMFVMVLTGSLRVNGATVVISPIKMSSASVYDQSMGGKMTSVAAVFAVPAAPSAGTFRYDLITCSAGGIISYTKGTAASSSPTIPATPAGSFALNTILLYPGMTSISALDIGRIWAAPTLSTMTATFQVNPGSGVNYGSWTLADGSVQTGYEVILSCFDQYSELMTGPGLGWPSVLTVQVGSATIYATPDGTAAHSISSLSVTVGSTHTFFIAASSATQYAQIMGQVTTSTAAVMVPIVIPA